MTGEKKTKVAILSFAHPHALSYARALVSRPDVDLLTADPDGTESPDGTDPDGTDLDGPNPDNTAAPDTGPRGAELAGELGVAYTDSYENVFAWAPDAVIVTTENARHRALVERAADAGAHILCEKPLATTLDDASAMLQAVERGGVSLMTAYPVRFSTSFAEARDRVRSRQLGDILGIRGTNNGKIPAGRAWFTDPALAGGGAFVDHVVHCADLIDELLGQKEQAAQSEQTVQTNQSNQTALSVRAVSNSIMHGGRRVDVETGGLVTMRYPGGVIATIDCSWSYPDTAPTWGGLTLQIIGTRGTITIAPFAQHAGGYDAAGAVYAPVGDDLDAAMIEAFLHGVRSGRGAQPDGAVGYRTLQIVDAARRSAFSGQPVLLA